MNRKFIPTEQTKRTANAVSAFTEQLNSKALNLGGLKLENYGTEHDTVSGGIASSIKNMLREAGLGRFSGRRTKRVMPGDHLKAVKFEDAQDAEGGDINDNYDEEPQLTKAQERAGVLAAAMADEPAEWAKKAQEATDRSESYANETGDAYESNERVKLEAYDDSNFRDAVGYSVAWNVVAARQSNALENIWPTLVLDPNQSHVEAVAQFQVFHHEVRHKSDGNAIDPGRVLLMEALIDGTIVDENLTKVVPCVNDQSKPHFIDPAIIPPHEVVVDGEEVMTAPLIIGLEHGLIGLGTGAIAGLTQDPNTAMQLAPMPRIENLYFRITNSAGETSVIRVDTTRIPRSSFTAPPEGNTREIQLNLVAQQIGLDATTTDVTGAPAKALDFLRTPDLQNHRVEFQIKVFGTGNLEFGNMEVNAGPGTVQTVKVVSGLGHFTKERDDSIVANIKSNITKIECIAFDPDASRTNIDRRQRGPLTNVTAERQKYWVRLGSPISTIFPATEATSNVDLIAPMTLTRIKNDYYGIKELFANAEVLNGLAVSYDNDLPRTVSNAIGRLIMMPYYKHVRISMLDIVDSNRSANKLEDMQHATLNYIRDLVIHGMRDSKYELALQVQSGNQELKPTLAMITNQVLGKYLFQLGDTRILGSLPYPVVADTHPSKLLGEYGSDEHELFIVPTLPGTQLDPLNFGHFLWKPELASTLQVTRDNSTNREVVVQPCVGWAMLCPWMIRVTITDLTHVMTTKTPLALLV